MGTKACDTISRPDSLTDIVAEKIRNAIIDSKFELGQPISENMLAQIYDISKTPIKLALARLRLEGLVEIYPQKGSFVFKASQTDMLQLVEWRCANELAALQGAFLKNKNELIETLVAIYKKMHVACELQDPRTSFNLDAEFHRDIVICSQNKYLLNAYDSNIHKMNAILVRCGTTPWENKERFEEHWEIITALKNDKLPHAKALLAIHIEHLCERMDLF